MKKILFILALTLLGCRKVEVKPEPILPIEKVDIFEQKNVEVQNGQDIEFKLDSMGKYTLVLFDSTNQQVISKEKFNGILGNNVKKIYTNSFNQKSLYLYLVTENNQQVKKTLITVK